MKQKVFLTWEALETGDVHENRRDFIGVSLIHSEARAQIEEASREDAQRLPAIGYERHDQGEDIWFTNTNSLGRRTEHSFEIEEHECNAPPTLDKEYTDWLIKEAQLEILQRILETGQVIVEQIACQDVAEGVGGYAMLRLIEDHIEEIEST